MVISGNFVCHSLNGQFVGTQVSPKSVIMSCCIKRLRITLKEAESLQPVKSKLRKELHTYTNDSHWRVTAEKYYPGISSFSAKPFYI
jgi:hypothetical protein